MQVGGTRSSPRLRASLKTWVSMLVHDLEPDGAAGLLRELVLVGGDGEGRGGRVHAGCVLGSFGRHIRYLCEGYVGRVVSSLVGLV